jgi:hypothetical protein
VLGDGYDAVARFLVEPLQQFPGNSLAALDPRDLRLILCDIRYSSADVRFILKNTQRNGIIAALWAINRQFHILGIGGGV